MKTILVPTDFSKTATNAVNYAAELAYQSNSKLLLFHAYYAPMLVGEVPLEITAEDMQLEEKSSKQMDLIVQGLQKKYEKKLLIDFLSMPGIASSEITDIAEERNCDLIVMGTKGESSTNNFWGSNTVDVVKQTQASVLVIPDKITFQKIDKIVLAFDYGIIKNESVFDPLVELATLFNSEILIFNMHDSRSHPASDEVLEGMKLDYIFKHLNHTFWFTEHKNIVDAINGFADNNHSVMISMIRRNHNLFHQIFTASNTKRMALHSHLPLLILHEQIDK